MSGDDTLVLPQGTPLIMVEMAIDCEERMPLFLAELPKVYAGRLDEPHPLTDGVHPSLLMEGHLAKCLASREFDTRIVLWSDEGETMLIFLAPEGDEHLRMHWVIEDLRGSVEAAEATNMCSWTSIEAMRQKLYHRVVDTFAWHIGNSCVGLISD